MSERSAELELTSWGVENTPGTAVGAALLFSSIAATAKPVEPSAMVTSPGFVSDVAQVKQSGVMVNIALNSPNLVCDDFLYMLASCYKAPTITTPTGATLARDATIAPAYITPGDGTGKTYTAEGRGSDGSGSRVAYCTLTGFDLNATDKAVAFTGSMIGRRLAEEGITNTSSPATIPIIPAPPTGLDGYFADALADLDDGQLLRLFSVKHTVSDRRAPVFPRQSALGGTFAATVSKKGKYATTVDIENDPQSYALMQRLRACAMIYARTIVRGPAIETVSGTTFYHEIEITKACKIMNPDRSFANDLAMASYTLAPVLDLSTGGLGGFIKYRIRTTLTALATASDLASGQQPPALISAAQVAGGFS